MNHFGSQNYKTVGMQESTHFLSPTEKQLFCICFRFSSGDVSILTFFNSREGDLPAASLAADLSPPPPRQPRPQKCHTCEESGNKKQDSCY